MPPRSLAAIPLVPLKMFALTCACAVLAGQVVLSLSLAPMAAHAPAVAAPAVAAAPAAPVAVPAPAIAAPATAVAARTPAVVVPASAVAVPAPAVAVLPRPAVTEAPSPAATPVVVQAPPPFSMTIDDDALTRAAASSFPQTMNGVTVSDPVVHVTAAGVRLTASARWPLGVTEFVMDATPYVSNGRVAVRVDSATLAGFPLPDSARAAISASVQGAIAGLVSAKMQVASVALGKGTLILKGVSN